MTKVSLMVSYLTVEAHGNSVAWPSSQWWNWAVNGGSLVSGSMHLKHYIMLHFKEWDWGRRSDSIRSLDLFEETEGNQLMPSSAGRCQDENVKIIFKSLLWRRRKTILGEPEGLATSLIFLLATLSLKKLSALLVSFTQANIQLLDKHLFILAT